MGRMGTCLWFDGKAEEAARFYVSLLPGSRIDAITRSPVDWPGGRAGEVLTVAFTLDGRGHLALNGGPHFSPNPAVSFMVECDDQAEIDRLWDALQAGGGAPMSCGWLTDRFGFAWQVQPRALGAMMQDPDPERVRRVMEAFMPMVKLDLAVIQAAYEGDRA